MSFCNSLTSVLLNRDTKSPRDFLILPYKKIKLFHKNWKNYLTVKLWNSIPPTFAPNILVHNNVSVFSRRLSLEHPSINDDETMTMVHDDYRVDIFGNKYFFNLSINALRACRKRRGSGVPVCYSASADYAIFKLHLL